MHEVVERGGSRWLLLVVLVAAGLAGLMIEGPGSSATTAAKDPSTSAARTKLDAVLADAVPVESLSTETSRTYRRPDGSFVTRVFAQAPGVDSSLKPVAGGFSADGVDATTRFPSSLADPVKIARGDSWVSMKLRGGAGSGRPDGSTITYAGALPGVDVRYRASNGAIGEELRLDAPDAPARYVFDLAASDGVRASTLPNGTILLTDAGGRKVFSLSPSYAFADRDRDATHEVKTALSETGEGWRLTLTVDEAWLRDELARGSVTIDPTVELQGATKDCALTSDTPSLSFCADDQLWIGWSGDHDHHALIKWDLSAIPKDAVALWGDAGLYQPSAYGIGVSKQLTLHRVTRDWTNGASWNTYDGTHAWTTPGGDFDAAPAATATVPANHGGWTDWSTTALVQRWVDGSLPNYGVAIQDKPGPQITGEEDYYSTEGTIPAQAPELDIVWTTRTGKPDFYTFESQALDAKATAAVNAANGNLLLSANDINAPGTGLPLKLDHYHNSLGDSSEVSALGIRGTASLGRDVHLHAFDDHTVAFSRGDGVTLPFIGAQVSGSTITWGSPAELASATLTKSTSTNTYVLHLPAGLPSYAGVGLTLTFDGAGKLLDIKDATGHTIALSYYPQGAAEFPALGGITDTNNVFWDVDRAYIGGERIVDITDPASHHTLFGYVNSSDNYLNKVTAANGAISRYAYDSSHRLKSITTPDGNVTLITYNGTTSKVATVVRTNNPAHTTGPTTTFTYGSPTSPCQSTSFDFTKTVVSRPDSTSTTYCANDHAQITYDTDNPTATPSGEWRDLAGGTINGRGVRSITLSATDQGAGVKKMALEEVGGAELAATTLACDPRNSANPIACPHATTATLTFDPIVLPEGVHTFRQTTTDYAGNIAHSATWTVEVRLERVVHASVYLDDPSTDPIAVSEDWAQLATLTGRSVEEDAISTRDDVACPSGTCAELRQRHLGGSGTPANDDGFVRYRGTSSSDTRIGVATDMIQLGLVSLGDTPASTGSTSNVVFPWQVLPPGAGTTYEVYESTGSIEDGGTATDGANGEEDSQTERQVRVRLVLDTTTKLPLRQTSFAVDDNELLSRRIWTYDPNVLFRRDLAADFFDVPRPAAPAFEKVVEYTEPAAPLAARQDAATGKAYEPATLERPVRLSRGRLCEVSRRNIAHTERPLPNEIPAGNGRPGEIYRSTRTISTFGAVTKAGRCPKDADPVLTVESAAVASPLAAAWQDGYVDLGAAIKSARGAAAKRSVQEVEIGGKTRSVPVLALGAGRRGAYLERDGTAIIVSGAYTPDELASIVTSIEG